MKRNAIPCLVLAAVMAGSSMPSVYAEETIQDIVSAQEQEDMPQKETSSEFETEDSHEMEQETSASSTTSETEGFEDLTQTDEFVSEQDHDITSTDEQTQSYSTQNNILSTQSIRSTSSITVRVRMDYPLTKGQIDKQNIQMKVFSAQSQENIPAQITYTYLKEDGTECGTEDFVAAIDIVASDLPAGTSDDVYTIAITGNGYRTYTYQTLSLEQSAKIITIGTKESTFTFGDVNGDDSIDLHDRTQIEQALGTNDAKCDLNQDGTVNIIDLFYVNRALLVQGSGKAIAQNGAMVSQAIVNQLDSKEIDLSEVVIAQDKSLSDLFVGTETVSISKTDQEEISESSPLNIPLVFSEGIAMSEVQIVTPANGGIENFDVIVETEEDGRIVTQTIPYQSIMPAAAKIATRDAENILVVNLGARKVVKKITIQVTKTADQQTAVIKQIAFVEDTLAKAPEKEASKPKNVTVQSGSKSVMLRWDTMANITGYKVYYGTTQNGMTSVASTESNQITIDGLQNLQKYYFTVVGTNGEWESALSQIVSATPVPDSKPVAPTTLQVVPMDAALRFSWGKTENTTGYIVYYRQKGTTEWTSKDVQNTTSLTVGNLSNGTTYEFCVEAYNTVGIGPRSAIAEGAPKAQQIEGPALPTENRIDNQWIQVRADSGAAGNVNKNECPNFKIEQVLDGNYATFWQSGAWWGNQSFTFDFTEPQSMNYMIYVPRQGDASYTTGMRDYHITTYRKLPNGTYEKIAEIQDTITAKVTSSDGGYLVLEMPESDDISRVTVNVGQWEGAKSVTLSEAAFYHLDHTPAEIADLFADGTFSTLRYSKEETLQKVEILRSRVENTNAFYLNQEYMLQELNDAQALAEGKTLEVQSGFQSRSTAVDQSAYGQTASVLQPLGVSANSGTEVVIYADIPEGETVTIVPTQYFAEYNAWKGAGIALKNGRNVITIPQISSVAPEKGGPLYLTYSGEHADAIRLRIVTNGTTSVKTPMLELSDWYTLTEAERKEKINAYVTQVQTYVQEKGNRLQQTSIQNHTDIATPSVLLSIPVKEVANGLTADTLYQAILAWEDVSYVVNTTQSIVDGKKETYQYPMQSRQNIRYMRMFGSAFMYAAGDHIGIGYHSAAPLVQGTPVTALHGQENGLYGWGIAHEIGHNMDKLGRTEITNNLYALMVQSYDGKDMTALQTRLEKEERYTAIFQKVAEARPGAANNVFVQLGMYWQLHLAYDNAENPMEFYNQFFALWKSGAYADGNDYDNRVALIASEVAQKDLTEFFTRWGMELTQSTKNTLEKYDEESRAIWYLNDDSRRNRLQGTGKANGTITLDSVDTAPAVGTSGQDVTLQFTHTDAENVLGYEILRDGKSIAFTTEPTYTDHIGTANHTVLTYAVRAVDKQGNVSDATNEKQVRISYDHVLAESLYTISQEGHTVTILMQNDKTQSVSGIKLSGVSDVESMPVIITTSVDGVEKETAFTLKQNMSSESNVWKSYFIKPGASEEDSRIWTYDVKKLVLENVPEDVQIQLIGAVSDDVAFLQDGAAIGRLQSDYQWGETTEEVIPAGSLVIVGTYVGDPQYNYVQINGEYTVRNLETGSETKETRPINGETYLFAEIPEDGEVSLISNGMFLYVVDEEAEAELDHMDCDHPSALPDRIQTVLYRTDTASSTEGRITAQTLWISSPDADGMPTIVLEHK